MRTRPMTPVLARWASALGLLGATAALAGCGATAQGSTGGAGKQTFVIGQQESGIVSLVRDSGALRGASYTVKWAVFPFGPPLVAAAAAGQIDLGDVGDVPPINGAAKESGFKVIAAEQYENPTDFIVVPKGSKITSLADLKGKRVGVPFGSSAHGFLLNAVQSAGLSPSDVHFVDLAPAALATAFRSGDLDAESIWNPQAAISVEGGGRILLAGRPPVDPDVGFYVGADRDLSNPTRRALLADLLARLGRAYEWGDEHPAVWERDIEAETGVDAATAASELHSGLLRVRYVSAATVATVQHLAQAFYSAHQISKPVDIGQIVDNLLTPTFAGH